MQTMKHALRDILLIAGLFGAIVGAPLVMGLLSSGKDEPPAVKLVAAPAQTENLPHIGNVTMEGMPPQPKPADAGDARSILDKLAGIEAGTPRNPTPEEPAQAGSSISFRPPEAPSGMDASNCEDARLGDKQQYDPRIVTGKGSSFVLPTSDLPKMTIVGGKGFDMLKPMGEGAVDADGKHIVSVEIYDLRNGQPNNLRIFAAGLAAMNGRHAMVFGDKEGDQVTLDPCLEWNDPIAIEDGPEPMLRYDAHDKDGNQASVSVTQGVKVIKPAQK